MCGPVCALCPFWVNASINLRLPGLEGQVSGLQTDVVQSSPVSLILGAPGTALRRENNRPAEATICAFSICKCS